MEVISSSPVPAPEGSLAYYKSQYEQLEHDLAEFQASSHQLEVELEKDVEAAEKRERNLKEKVENLGFEVDEWKAKYKQSKLEASAAQSTLQKEITTLRDANRSLQLKLRDIEVENDDFERQARNTSSSLEDLESKYNVAIERVVLMEEEIKVGEQERENLRIENQRLRDELSDVKIEAEVMQDKFRKLQSSLTATTTTTNTLSDDSFSPDKSISSPLITTPPETKLINFIKPGNETPPSPPISETSGPMKASINTPTSVPKSRLRLPSRDFSVTPKVTARYASSGFRNSRGSAVTGRNDRIRNATPSVIRHTKAKAPATRGLPNSNSLTHIRSLTAQMQRLEQRVQSARSKLPTPVVTPPRSSPRSEQPNTQIPSSVTIRTKRKIAGSSISISSTTSEDPQDLLSKHNSTSSITGVSRLSFGSDQIKTNDTRTSSRLSGNYIRSDRPASRSELARPLSRASNSGMRNSFGIFSQSQYSESQRLRLSLGSSYGSSPHGHRQSKSNSRVNLEDNRMLHCVSPTRRKTCGKSEETSSIPVYNAGLRRKSGPSVPSSRQNGSENIFNSDMKPPSRPRKLSDLGETY
ncbi:Nuclear distribution protein nudE-like protein 1 [Erysiphe neolycopersici]|uniref:Nuclear distribution protein nudE-like protein 1 n=1 Tax=Erysiphe neolycopersici TaxID=212602 RepID=A0A420HU66_9PEZI|nr:Nuclear distribution protein nudE-like protein 1 [Erysiphe neolycopersici]